MFGAGSRRAQCSIAREWPREFMSSLPGNRSPGSRHSELTSSVASVCAVRVVASRASGWRCDFAPGCTVPSRARRVPPPRIIQWHRHGKIAGARHCDLSGGVEPRSVCTEQSSKGHSQCGCGSGVGSGFFLSQSARLGHAFTRSTRTARRRRRARCGCRWST